MRNPAAGLVLTSLLFLECVDAKKHCWYFEGGYPIYFMCAPSTSYFKKNRVGARTCAVCKPSVPQSCRSYEDCCGTRCCVRALSIHRLWYFWLLLMMAVFFCCGTGFFIRRRIYPSPLRDEPTFNVSFTRHPASTPAPQQPGGLQGINGVAGGEPASPGTHPLYRAEPGPAHKMVAFYSPPPSYCNHPPPSYEQVFQNYDKK